MISDPQALQYILNSPNFTHGVTSKTIMGFVFDEKAIVAANGWFIVAKCFHTDQ
jgi:hypothetical protein